MAGKAANSVPSSMMEGLSNVLPDIASCMAAPDADIPKLMKLQQVVLLMIHEPAEKLKQQQAQQGQPGQPGSAPGGPGGAPPGAAGPGGGGAPQGMSLPGGPPGAGAANGQMRSQGAPQPPTEPGGVSKPLTPDPEEMRRVLASSAGSEDDGG